MATLPIIFMPDFCSVAMPCVETHGHASLLVPDRLLQIFQGDYEMLQVFGR
jgi:hypothetical protein